MRRCAYQKQKLCRNVLAAALRGHGRLAYAGGVPKAREWFSFRGSMTRSLRGMGHLTVRAEWFRVFISLNPQRVHVWMRHVTLQTPLAEVEAWVWMPLSQRFAERRWFEAGHQPIGEVLFRRSQRRQFKFFKVVDEPRIFRYSCLRSPRGIPIHLVEAVLV